MIDFIGAEMPENTPEEEHWLWKNPEALASVRRGIEQAEAGNVVSLGSFSEFADDLTECHHAAR